MFGAIKDHKKRLRAKYGAPCPECQRLLPKAHPSILLPQQVCRIHKYRDPRPALEKVGLHLWTKRVERDDNYINAMELDLIEFEKLVTENETKLRNYHSKPADITPPWEREAA